MADFGTDRQKKAVTLNYSESEQITLEADKSRLIQVFLNLLDNAIKHSPAGGQILVQVNSTPDNLTIDIIDAGTGFANSDLPYIFDRLYRGDLARTRENTSNGSGLGLAIVQQIVQAHHGQIIAKNHPELGGAWFQIVLPLKSSK